MPAPPPAQLTHVGLYVEDMDKMADFYQRLMGMVVTDQGEFLGKRLTFLSRDADEHHQLVLVTGRKVPDGVLLLSQVSFRLEEEDLVGLRWFRRTAIELGATGMEGRNHGNSWSIYFEDPEGNRVEVYTATPWYVRQPWREALDLTEPNDTIEATTRALIEEGATWQPVATWRADLAARLGQAAP
jgi:catechol 2,3-dioxygenase